jgi:molybdopterin converting factor small subunit
VQVPGSNVGEVLSSLVAEYPELRGHLLTSEGRLRSFVNLYLNDEDVRYTGLERTPVKDSDVLSIVPSIAGGACAVALVCSSSRC